MGNEAIPHGTGFAEAGQPKNPTALQVILYAVLTLLVVAMVYDLAVARREWKAAIERLNAKIRGPQSGAKVVRVDPITREEVTELIGRPPAETTEEPAYYLEHYQWLRGIPWKHYDLYVIFSKGTIPLLHDISYPGPPDRSQFPREELFAPVEPPDS